MINNNPGIKILLTIDLPIEGWITVKAETLYLRDEFGFGVRFVETSEEAAGRTLRALRSTS